MMSLGDILGADSLRRMRCFPQFSVIKLQVLLVLSFPSHQVLFLGGAPLWELKPATFLNGLILMQ